MSAITVNYTRWEIGGEPQPMAMSLDDPIIIPDGRSGGNRNLNSSAERSPSIIPDGRSGGNRNSGEENMNSPLLYPMGDRGGTATILVRDHNFRVLYPMGDRGGTATGRLRYAPPFYYTRWEIGGEPQRPCTSGTMGNDYTRWEIGGEPQPSVPP